MGPRARHSPKCFMFVVLAAVLSLAVVILASPDDEKGIVLSDADGANSDVRKPVDFKEFMRAVQDVGLYWPITNTTAPNG